MYDDEWFSLSLATLPATSLRASLINDFLHPPWVGLFDRAVASITPSLRALALARLLPSLGAVWLLGLVARRRLGVRWPVLAAFQPIVFFYAVSARWYPFLFLAQALRAWALWGTHRARRARLAFSLGAVLGLLSCYADLVFLPIDAAAWIARRRSVRKKVAFSTALTFVGALALLGIALLWFSPVLARQLPALKKSLLRHRLSPGGDAEWLATGLAGQSFFPGYVLPTIALSLPGYAWSVVALLPKLRCRRFLIWLAAAMAGWLLVELVGTSTQPRSSLLVWFLLASALLAVLSKPGKPRFAAALSLGILGLGLAATISLRLSLKGDLNVLPQEVCGPIAGMNADALLVVPYPRTADDLLTRCRPRPPIVSADWTAHVGATGADELAPIRSALPGHAHVTLVTVAGEREGMTQTMEAATELLAAKCRPEKALSLGRDLHADFKRRMGRSVPDYRYELRNWDCR